jgi:elongation factor Ts
MTMAEITGEMVRRLRERTGAGLMECKRALETAGGNEEVAVDNLRKSGLKTAEKKAGREMSEGRVKSYIAPDARSGALVALTCETDFVARNQEFEVLLADAAKLAADTKCSDATALAGAAYKGSTLGETIKLMVGKIGENISVGKAAAYTNASGFVGCYVHHDGKKAAIVSVKTTGDQAKAVAMLKELSMHIVFSNPVALSRAEIDAEKVQREREIYLEEVKSKPADIQEKIVAGKLSAFYAQWVLPEQRWFADDSKTVQQALEAELGKGATIDGFARFQIGG